MLLSAVMSPQLNQKKSMRRAIFNHHHIFSDVDRSLYALNTSFAEVTMLRSKRVHAVLWALLPLIGSLASGPALAATDYCWIDAQTGEKVATVPSGSVNFTMGESETPVDVTIDPTNRNSAHSLRTGKNFVRLDDGSWIDAKTGKQVPTAPSGSANFTMGESKTPVDVTFDPTNRNSAHSLRTGKNFVRVPCTTTAATTSHSVKTKPGKDVTPPPAPMPPILYIKPAHESN